MAGLTLAHAEAQLALWLEADANLASNQAATIDGRSVTRAETLEKIQYWDQMCRRLDRGSAARVSVQRIVASDG